MKALLRASLLLLAAAPGSHAFSQATLSADVETMYDDNVNNNYQHTASPVTTLGLQGAYLWDAETSSLALSYGGALSYFSVLPARSFHTHEAGLSYALSADEGERTLFNASATYSMRVDRDDYTFYDHGQLAFHGTVKHRFSEEILGKAGYTFRSVRFAKLGDFNYLEHFAFVQLTSLLPTNSTLILEADLGSKGYTTPNISSTQASLGRGMRQGRMTVEAPSVTQLIGVARIGHPVAEGTGLSLTFRYQGNLQKESRYLVFNDGTLSDDEILDDHYGYEGSLGTLMLTQMLPADTRMRISASLQERTYANRPVYVLAGVPTADSRRDTRQSLTVQLSKSLKALGFTLGLSYDHIINRSNDPYFDYRNNALSLMVSLGND